jgi:multiple sugar transport system permease protein
MNGIPKAFLVVCCLASLTPVAWHADISLKDPAELALIPPTLVPEEPTLVNYQELFRKRPFFRYCLNSFAISASASIVAILCGSLAAYRLARIRGRMRSSIRSVLLAVAFFPPIVFLFPLYEMIRTVGLVNHPWGLILPYSALNLPFAIWLLTGAFEQIPYELEEAAAIDGLTRLETYSRILLPLAAPAMVTAGILVFIFSWNEFMFALTPMNIDSQKTVTVAVTTLSGAFAYEIPWGQMAAGVIVSSLQLIVLAVFFQRKVVAGLTAGSLFNQARVHQTHPRAVQSRRHRNPVPRPDDKPQGIGIARGPAPPVRCHFVEALRFLRTIAIRIRRKDVNRTI